MYRAANRGEPDAGQGQDHVGVPRSIAQQAEQQECGPIRQGIPPVSRRRPFLLGIKLTIPSLQPKGPVPEELQSGHPPDHWNAQPLRDGRGEALP